MDVYHNSFDPKYREPFGAAPKGSNVTLTIDVPNRQNVSRVVLHYIYDKTDKEHTIEMDVYSEEHQNNSFEATIEMPEEPQLVWYYFEIVTKDKSFYYGRVNIEESGEGTLYEQVPPSWQITVYDADYDTPSWWRHSTMYQIFPDRFYREGPPDLSKAPKTSLMHSHWENDPYYIRDEDGGVVRWDFFGGTLQGIIQKLDYIQSLGTTVIYLNPIFEAESNHRYDTGDYHSIDPLLGTKEDFEELIRKAEGLGMEVMLDGVFNHTGSNSIYFNQKGEYDSLGAYQSQDSPYYPWYQFHSFPDEYEAWWGVGTLPTINKDEKSFQNFLIHDKDSVLKTWQKSGLNHWRLDVADELTDDIIRQIYQQIKQKNSSSVLLGEVWEDATNKIGHGKRREYFLGGVLDSVMNYPLRDLMLGFVQGEVDALYIHRRLKTLQEHYPKANFFSLMNMLSSHDVERVLTMLDNFLPEEMEEEERKETIYAQVKALSLWLYVFPGVPSLYYGDEAGVTGGSDPDNRKPYPWGREDEELLSWYKTIGSWRKDHQALRTGSWNAYAPHQDIYAFERSIDNNVDYFGDEAANEHLIYVFNRNLHESIEFTLPARKGKWQHLENKKRIFKAKDDKLTLSLQPSESMLLRHMH
ncbi:glycoside hydrolase family 13 protein [Halobacillus massiliensis]|uniref:glycoside hydrolase family 13 protein n=1 Tax=Halobacillus massiliensis TaxID=1926286 RepID=UPI001FED0702|nr:glycoside hydrolase family 13 protein [Halobacillus massiliensis]